MKMYYFSRGGYNEEYHIMAESKSDALLYFRRYCENRDIGTIEAMKVHLKDYFLKEYEFFCKNPEFIYELGEGEVIQTEVS